MSLLQLALKSQLPLICIQTTDQLNVEEVLQHVAGTKVSAFDLPEAIPGKQSDIKFPGTSRILYTSVVPKGLVRLYRACVDAEKTIVFINPREKHSLMFDGGHLHPPADLVIKTLVQICDDQELAEELLPAFGGLSLKDVSEVAALTMTRDGGLSSRGVNETRRGYHGSLPGIDQVDTALSYYVCPEELQAWLDANLHFFLKPPHPSMMPRGLLFDGPPGTGKTLAAKHIAATFGVPLYRLDLGAMMGKYVGESEGNLLAALEQIDQVEPCVVLFDEAEKVFGTSGHEVSTRMMSQLLWWMQEHKTKVFSVMTTNNIKQIPEELHREGRIDETMLFAGIDNLDEAQAFALGAAEQMAAQIELKLTVANDKKISTRVAALFPGPVPQAKIVQAVLSLLKTFTVKESAQ